MNDQDCPPEPAEKDGLVSGYPAGLPAIIINTDSNLEFADEDSVSDLTRELANENRLTDYLSPDKMTGDSDGDSNKIAGQSTSSRTCTRPNAALKPACVVDTELERTITRAIMSRRVAAETAGLLEDVLEQQTNSPSSSPVSPSSRATQATANDLPANSRTNSSSSTVCATACSSTLDATRQGVSLKHFDELVESALEAGAENSDGVQCTLNETSNNSIEHDDSSARTVLTQNTVRAHGNSIKTSNYSADRVPDGLNSEKQRDFSSADRDVESEVLPDDSFIENVLDGHCASVISSKPTGIRAETGERKLRKVAAITSDDYDRPVQQTVRTVSGGSLINFIDSTIGDSTDDLIIRPKSSSSDDVFGNESFLDCPNLVVNCDLENTQNSNSSAFLVNPSGFSSNLLTTVDSADLVGAELLGNELIKPIDEQPESSQVIQLSGHSNALDPQVASNSNNLLTTVLFISDSGELTSDRQSSTTGANNLFNSDCLPNNTVNNSLQTFKSPATSLPTTSDRTQISSLPINARVLLIENLAQLSELASGQSLILTTPLLQKSPADSNEKARTRQTSSVISHCTALIAEPNNKRPKKLRRQLAIDDSELPSDPQKKSKSVCNEQPKSDHVLVIKELNTVDNCLESSSELVENSGEITGAKSNSEEEGSKADKEESGDQKSDKENKKMLDATDFRGVLNAAAVLNAGLNAVAEHQSTYQLNGRLTPPGYGQHSAQSQLTSQQYATLQPLPPISTMSDKFHDKFAHHYVLNSGNHGNSSSSAGNQSVINASNCASNAVHPGFALMPNTTLGKTNYPPRISGDFAFLLKAENRN